MNIQFSLCLPRDAGTLAVVRSVAAAALGSMGVTTECVDDIRLALSEACANVIEHAHAAHEYEVQLEVDSQRCTIRVIDPDGTLDVGDLAEQMPDAASTSGRGAPMMRAVTDESGFTSEPETGTIVHLVKNLDLEPDSPLARLHSD